MKGLQTRPVGYCAAYVQSIYLRLADQPSFAREVRVKGIVSLI